jgi:hypothetical protein
MSDREMPIEPSETLDNVMTLDEYRALKLKILHELFFNDNEETK